MTSIPFIRALQPVSDLFECLKTFDLSHSAEKVKKLLDKYSSVPMDFADSCLMLLAKELNTAYIFTLDAYFAIYRWGRNQLFKNLIEQPL